MDCFITERDKKLFQFLFENKVATFSQLKSVFFTGAAHQNAYRRLLALLKTGWLRRRDYASGDRVRCVYGLTEKSYLEFVLREGENDRRSQLESDSMAHDLALVDIRLAFEQNAAVNRVIPENLLQSCQAYSRDDRFQHLVTMRADAATEIRLGEEVYIVPVEYEASLKSKDRCHEKLMRYHGLYEGELVIFICKNAGIISRMAETERGLGKKFPPKMYFGLLEDVLGSPRRLIFTKAKGEQIILE